MISQDTIGGKLSYKGRVDLDKCEIIDIQDGECMSCDCYVTCHVTLMSYSITWR